MTPTFDPFQVLLGMPEMTLGFHELQGVLGLYFDDLKTIVLQKGLLQVQRRCTLAHELAHYKLEHSSCADRRAAARQELEAEVVAGRWLMPIDALIAARMTYDGDDALVADELWVDVPMLQTFERNGLTRRERAYVHHSLRIRNEGVA